MFHHDEFFLPPTDTLQKRGAYRTFLEIERRAGALPTTLKYGPGDGRRISVWCGNDCLGMGQHPLVLAARKKATDEAGAASRGSRDLAGDDRHHVALEEELADLHGMESALIFPSGYSANDAALTVLAGRPPGCVVFADDLNHPSMTAGIQHSGAEKHVFRHNDTDHLEELLAGTEPSVPKIIALESIYAMGSDPAPLERIAELARHHGAFTYLDEAHAVGVYGPRGAGLAAERQLGGHFDVVRGTLEMAFGTAGGYIAGSGAVIDAVRSFASAFLFTASLPPAAAAGALAAVRHLKRSDGERAALHRKAALLQGLLRADGIPVASEAAHIVPVLVGDAVRCRNVARRLLDQYGCYVQPVNAPSVPVGSERLRITPAPHHSDDEIVGFAHALDSVWECEGLPRTLRRVPV